MPIWAIRDEIPKKIRLEAEGLPKAVWGFENVRRARGSEFPNPAILMIANPETCLQALTAFFRIPLFENNVFPDTSPYPGGAGIKQENLNHG